MQREEKGLAAPPVLQLALSGSPVDAGRRRFLASGRLPFSLRRGVSPSREIPEQSGVLSAPGLERIGRCSPF